MSFLKFETSKKIIWAEIPKFLKDCNFEWFYNPFFSDKHLISGFSSWKFKFSIKTTCYAFKVASKHPKEKSVLNPKVPILKSYCKHGKIRVEIFYVCSKKYQIDTIN
jgi:hypothetical protein